MNTPKVVEPSHLDRDEADLWRLYKVEGRASAREKLFGLYFPFARTLAKRHFLDRQRGDIEFLELCQLASTGLLEALDHFDPGRGAPFRAYAARRISGSILNGLAKLSEVREQISFRNQTHRDRLRSLAVDEAETLPMDQALQALIDLAVGLALGFMLEGTGLYLADEGDERSSDAYESLAWKETVSRVASEVAQMADRDQSIIKWHYMDGLSFEQIAKALGLTKGRVSQLHRQALGLLRKRLSRVPITLTAERPK